MLIYFSFNFILFNLTCLFHFQAQYIFVHESILETILCGMNEVDSTNVQKEIETLAEAKENGMTGFQEKFKVSDLFKQTICWKQTPKFIVEYI